LAIVALALTGCAELLGPPAGPEAFQFDAKRVPTGTVYHYVKSNKDDSAPEQVALYVADRDTIEVMKFREPRSTVTNTVRATMDWSLASVSKLESAQVSQLGSEKPVAIAEYSALSRSLTVEIFGHARQILQIGYVPFHVYSFDFASLNMAFRHLKDPLAEFTIGVTEPTFAATGPIFAYRGEATISYVGDEIRNNALCRRYRISGAGIGNREGLIWVNKAEGHIVDLEIDKPNHPDWQSFKLKLMSREIMTAEQWRCHKCNCCPKK
jgi:hypothetical protein